jgi:transcription elongation GreA/GreB family factor
MIRTHEIRLTELDAAAIVPSASIDPNVVTMNSTVVLEPRPCGERTTLTLVYPKDVDPEQSKVSVLSPVGRALLGARANDRVHVVVPGYGERELAPGGTHLPARGEWPLRPLRVDVSLRDRQHGVA